MDVGPDRQHAVSEVVHVVRFMDGVSFTVAFTLGNDAARITDALGWTANAVACAEGTYEQIRAEAHRLVDLAVDTGRCSKHGGAAAGAELKRGITRARTVARSAPRGIPHR